MSIFFVMFLQLAHAQPTAIQAEYGKGELIAACKSAIAKADDKFKALAALKPEQRNFESTMLAFEDINTEAGDVIRPLVFMKNVSLSADTRKESQDCSKLISQFFNDVSTRRELYNAIKDAKPRNAEEKRLATETIKGFEENGMKLSDENLKKFRALKDELSEAELTFGNNLRNDNSEVLLTATELPGVSADWLGSLEKNDQGQLRIAAKEANFFEIEQNCSNADTRKKLMTAMYNRGGDANIKLLEKAIGIRQKISDLLGFKTWADYKVDDYMAHDSATVMKFLNDLRDRLAAPNRADMNELLKFKQESDSKATRVEQWDLYYLPTQLQKKKFQLDVQKAREYFPADVVIPGLLQIYSDMLGVKFKEVPGAKVWAPDVKQYEIRNKKDDRLIGFFYLDLYGREGKYTHAAAASLIPGHRMKDGKYNYPIAAIFANLSAPTPGKPSLMTLANHGDVEVLFHEFGHVMHQTLTRAPYASFSGTSVKRDFVEAPSQMLENFVYQKEILNILSGHYQDHTKKLPAEMLKGIIEVRDFQQARFNTRQVLLASYDMQINMQHGPVDTLKMYETLYREITGDPPMTGIKFPAGFGHLMGGYDAGYYGYLWSKVYAQDMFTIFQKAGVTSPSAGARYRKYILEPGNMEDPKVLVTKFLGREPNSKAFMKSVGAK